MPSELMIGGTLLTSLEPHLWKHAQAWELTNHDSAQCSCAEVPNSGLTERSPEVSQGLGERWQFC